MLHVIFDTVWEKALLVLAQVCYFLHSLLSLLVASGQYLYTVSFSLFLSVF